MAIGLSKDRKSVFNKACTMPWCHTVVHFEAKMSRFTAVFQDDRPDGGSTSPKQARQSTTRAFMLPAPRKFLQHKGWCIQKAEKLANTIFILAIPAEKKSQLTAYTVTHKILHSVHTV